MSPTLLGVIIHSFLSVTQSDSPISVEAPTAYRELDQLLAEWLPGDRLKLQPLESQTHTQICKWQDQKLLNAPRTVIHHSFVWLANEWLDQRTNNRTKCSEKPKSARQVSASFRSLLQFPDRCCRKGIWHNISSNSSTVRGHSHLQGKCVSVSR